MTIAAAHSHHSWRSSRRKFIRTALANGSGGLFFDVGWCRCNDHPQEPTTRRDLKRFPRPGAYTQYGPLKPPLYFCTKPTIGVLSFVPRTNARC